ncbi:peptidyl-alpha-hydroxyglycine alpha-amidating lyase family protein [Mucilaginibacter sp. HD30]
MKKVLILILALIILAAAYMFSGRSLENNRIPVSGWPVLPNDFQLGEPSGLAIDSADNLVVFHRAGRQWPLLGPMPDTVIKNNTITVFSNKTGELLRSWGGNMFVMPHGLCIDRKGNYWLTDVGLHQVFKYSPAGKLLLKLGEAGLPGADRFHFDKPTDVAVAEDGSFYVSDGYGNSRIVKFSAQGKYLLEWGRKGSGDGEFNIPHNLELDNTGNVYVADRENKRIQVFTPNGRFIRKITSPNFGKITSLAFGSNGRLYAADDANILGLLHRGSNIFEIPDNAAPRVLAGQAGWFHAIAIDSDGNLYAGDISKNKIFKFLGPE